MKVKDKGLHDLEGRQKDESMAKYILDWEKRCTSNYKKHIWNENMMWNEHTNTKVKISDSDSTKKNHGVINQVQ